MNRTSVAFLLALSGCQGLASGTTAPAKSDAPAVYNVGVLATNSSVDGVARSSRADQSGAVGASSTATSTTTQTQTTQIDPEAVGKAITDLAGSVTSPAGKALLDSAQAELANGDAEAASRTIKRAAAAEKAAKVEPKPEPPK